MGFQPTDEDLILPEDPDPVRVEMQADLDTALAIRNDLRALMGRARDLAGRPGFRQPGRVVARHVEDAICSMNDWFGGPDDDGYKLRPPVNQCVRCGRGSNERIMALGPGRKFLCHANLDGTKSDPDCYHLFTVYGDKLSGG